MGLLQACDVLVDVEPAQNSCKSKTAAIDESFVTVYFVSGNRCSRVPITYSNLRRVNGHCTDVCVQRLSRP